jgi:redox-regulated HSP33 family molecular chaperone
MRDHGLCLCEGANKRNALAAIDRRDVDALVVADGKIDQACESCHTIYWYPGEAKPR